MQFPPASKTTYIIAITALCVAAFASNALANPLVVTHFDTTLARILSFTAFFLIETLVFKYAAKVTWKFSAVAVFLANLFTTFLGYEYSEWLSEYIAQVGAYSHGPTSSDMTWAEFALRAVLGAWPDLLAHSIFCLLTTFFEILVIAGVALHFKQYQSRKFILPALYANMASYGALFFLVVLPCLAIFEFIYADGSALDMP